MECPRILVTLYSPNIIKQFNFCLQRKGDFYHFSHADTKIFKSFKILYLYEKDFFSFLKVFLLNNLPIRFPKFCLNFQLEDNYPNLSYDVENIYFNQVPEEILNYVKIANMVTIIE